MTNEELLSVAEIVERATNRFNAQAAYHRERFDEHVKLIASMKADHEAKMVEHRAAFGARTEADAKIIAGLRAEIIRVNEAHGRTKVENDGLRDELTAQRDAFTAEVERIRRELHEGRDAEATAKLAPKVGDTVRLVTHPERGQVAEHLRTALKWPWIDRWGVVGQTGKVVKPLVAVAEAVAVALDGSTIFARWPIACLEVVSEATHDTEAGKAVAESAVSETVADEIKVGDVAKVVGASVGLTAQSYIGKIGEVLKIDFGDETVLLSGAGWVNHRDVRKVTT